MTIVGFSDHLGLLFGQFVFIDPILRNLRNIGASHFHPFTLFRAFMLFSAPSGEHVVHRVFFGPSFGGDREEIFHGAGVLRGTSGLQGQSDPPG
jgi:hypothetical protein